MRQLTSDGNDVGRNISRDITTLGLNDGEGSERTSSLGLVHLGSSLKQSRVQVEDLHVSLNHDEPAGGCLHLRGKPLVREVVAKAETFVGKQRLAWTNRRR